MEESLSGSKSTVICKAAAGIIKRKTSTPELLDTRIHTLNLYTGKSMDRKIVFLMKSENRLFLNCFVILIFQLKPYFFGCYLMFSYLS